MNAISNPITGTETIEMNKAPFEALVEFYRAFNGRDLALMQSNWLGTEEASMSNPLGGVCRGWEAIQEVYAKIFEGKAEVYVEFYDYTIHDSHDMFCAVGREKGYFRMDGMQVELAIRTSRIYRKVQGKWRQLHHHGSIDDPALLAEYQSAVRGR
jgi:ketosteroid isomerase-like protein